MEFYTYDHSPFDEEPINIQEYVEAAIRHMQGCDPKFNAEMFRALIAQIPEEELRERIHDLESANQMRYNNKEWLDQTIQSNVSLMMEQAVGGAF